DAYTLVVTNLINGCTASSTAEYLTTPDLIYPSVFPSALPCGGGTTIIGLENAIPSDYEGLVLSWATPNGNIVSPTDSISIQVDQAGTYCFTAVDTINGCVLTDCDTVYDEINLSLIVPDVICHSSPIYLHLVTGRPLPDMLFYNIFIDIEGLPLFQETSYNEPIYAYQVLFDEPRQVKIWVENQAGTCVSDTLVKLIVPDLPHTISVEENGCQPVQATVSLNVPDPSGYELLWSDDQGLAISDLTTISITETGWFYLSITNEQGNCTWFDSIFVTIPFQGNCATISGNALQNLNGDCLPNATDTPLSGWLIQAIGLDTFYATTDINGNYLMPVDPGSYTVSILQPNAFWEPCGNGFSVNLPNPDDEATVDFLLKKLPGCPEMVVDITTPLLRRCFPSNYFVNYCNQGVEPATDAYVTVDLDDFLTFNSASIAHADLGNNLYRFDLGNLNPGDCGSFNINATVSCNAVLGQTHCTEAHIYPDSSCVANDPLWSGASLRVVAVCDGDSLRFTITNEGSAQSVPLDYVVIEDAVMYLEDPPSPALGPDESFELVVPANGSTWRLELQQEPYHPVAALPIVAVEGCGPNFSTGFVNQFPLGDEPPFLDIDCTENIGSYDPNDKQGFPIGYGNEHQILPGTELQYLIRFQNTGTDTAFTVVVRDTLSSFLDITSIRPGAASHPYLFETYSEGVLKFTFNDILLPDSSTNQAGSNGFVHFTARPRADLPLGSVIENSAAIYFDFNEPVLTNTVFHTIDSNFIEVSHVYHTVRDVQVQVSPNPFEASLRVALKGVPAGKPLTFSVLDATGRLVRQQGFTAPGFVFAAQNMTPGLYFFKIEDAGTLIASGRVVRH
ncbi:MAG: T9SS type A sorting domain-containing protein, partial [Saprospiraceae bacterium]|nr:T9SS type A sorting domain-containing protein [Saprospiraceae bacterium]